MNVCTIYVHCHQVASLLTGFMAVINRAFQLKTTCKRYLTEQNTAEKYKYKCAKCTVNECTDFGGAIAKPTKIVTQLQTTILVGYRLTVMFRG